MIAIDRARGRLAGTGLHERAPRRTFGRTDGRQRLRDEGAQQDRRSDRGEKSGGSARTFHAGIIGTDFPAPGPLRTIGRWRFIASAALPS